MGKDFKNLLANKESSKKEKDIKNLFKKFSRLKL